VGGGGCPGVLDRGPKLSREEARSRPTLLVLDGPNLAWWCVKDSAIREAAADVDLSPFDEIIWASSSEKPMLFHYVWKDGRLLAEPAEWQAFLEAERELANREFRRANEARRPALTMELARYRRLAAPRGTRARASGPAR
jgi:hypothetical protein